MEENGSLGIFSLIYPIIPPSAYECLIDGLGSLWQGMNGLSRGMAVL